MVAKPMKTIELHYPVIQFLIKKNYQYLIVHLKHMLPNIWSAVLTAKHQSVTTTVTTDNQEHFFFIWSSKKSQICLTSVLKIAFIFREIRKKRQKFMTLNSNHFKINKLMTSAIKETRKTTRFVVVFTSRNVTSFPSWTITMSSALYFIFLFMKRNKCFWFMPEAAWTWVSTWKNMMKSISRQSVTPKLIIDSDRIAQLYVSCLACQNIRLTFLTL